MTIDEAIRHYEEVAEENDLAAGMYGILAENSHNIYERLTAETKSSRCAECAADRRQLAEWLRELKEAKRLLKEAVEDFTAIAEVHASATPILCSQYGKYLKTIDVRTRKWRYTDEALKLIEGNVGNDDERVNNLYKEAEEISNNAGDTKEGG